MFPLGVGGHLRDEDHVAVRVGSVQLMKYLADRRAKLLRSDLAESIIHSERANETIGLLRYSPLPFGSVPKRYPCRPAKG